MSFHIAELNIARIRAPIDSPVMAEFVAQLEAINTLGDRSPGFVWRLKTDSGDATAIQAFDDDRVIVNLTVWEDIDALFQYTYYSGHVDAYRRRSDWFEKLDLPGTVLWWIPSGHIPTVAEAVSRLEYLREHGPTPQAFTFKQRFTPQEFIAFQKQSEDPF